ncbi:MAG: tryptophan-rich sensory protein [Candidatus Diapherotrites archaeon]|nr:tryptophan-rich sensory protein [Candidatus Diapherotrites archaeon]
MEIKIVLVLIAFILVSHLAGVIGSVFTFEAIPNWYSTLERPSFAPPNFLFGPVWLTLYTMMGIAAFLVWRKKKSKFALNLYWGQLSLNAIWSILFFGLKSPGVAFLEIIFLWLMIVITTLKFLELDKRAAWLMIPYILWVSFAAMLNFSFWILNP